VEPTAGAEADPGRARAGSDGEVEPAVHGVADGISRDGRAAAKSIAKALVRLRSVRMKFS
jgi:hypothetical protein